MPSAKTSTSCRSKSICQKSVEIAVTFTKISSLYLATFLLPRGHKPADKPPPPPQPPTTKDDCQQLVSEQDSRPAAYVMEPDEAVDTRASEYIRRRHVGVYGHIDDNVRKEVAKCIPPPPPPKNKWDAGVATGGYYRRYYKD